MNGEPMPLAHGGPLRLIVPGYNGVNNVKYVKRVAFTRPSRTATIHEHGYRHDAARHAGDPSRALGAGA